MTAQRRTEPEAGRVDTDSASQPLLARLAAIREASTRLKLDPRDSTELLRELRECAAR